MSWVLLFIAILFEIVGTTSAKLSQGFSRVLPTAVMFACYARSISLFNLSLKKIGVIPYVRLRGQSAPQRDDNFSGVAYAVWAGWGRR